MASNKTVKTTDFRKVIQHWGLSLKGTNGSHERWSRPGMVRPVIIQATHKEIPSFIFKNNLKTLDKTEEEFFEALASL